MHRQLTCAALTQSCGGVRADVFCAPVNRPILALIRLSTGVVAKIHSSIVDTVKEDVVYSWPATIGLMSFKMVLLGTPVRALQVESCVLQQRCYYVRRGSKRRSHPSHIIAAPAPQQKRTPWWRKSLQHGRTAAHTQCGASRACAPASIIHRDSRCSRSRCVYAPLMSTALP